MTYKLGPHIIEPTAEALAFASSAPIALAMDDSIASLMGSNRPAITVYRHYFSDQPLNRNGEDIAAEIIGVLNSRGGIRPDYVCLYNEAVKSNDPNLPRYVQLHWEAVPLLHANGLKVAGFSYSVGNGEIADWQYIQSQGFGGVDAISVHEYWGDTLFSDWTALRHRRVHDWLGGNHPPFIITECGRDRVESDGVNCYGDYTHCGWIQQRIPPDQYVNELLAYDAEIARDPYVLGATVFTAGCLGTEWCNFNVDQIYQRILGMVGPPTPPRGRLPIAPILLIGLAALMGLYAVAALEAGEEEEEE
jgi:hypothetical protein